MGKDLELGKRIAWLRTNKGLEQKEIAKAIDIIYGTYQLYEYGNHPNRKNIDKILKYYKCDLSWLLTGEGVPYPDRPLEKPPDISASSNNVAYLKPEIRILEEAVAEAGVPVNEMQRLALLEIIRKELTRVEGEIANLIKVFKK